MAGQGFGDIGDRESGDGTRDRNLGTIGDTEDGDGTFGPGGDKGQGLGDGGDRNLGTLGIWGWDIWDAVTRDNWEYGDGTFGMTRDRDLGTNPHS